MALGGRVRRRAAAHVRLGDGEPDESDDGSCTPHGGRSIGGGGAAADAWNARRRRQSLVAAAAA